MIDPGDTSLAVTVFTSRTGDNSGAADAFLSYCTDYRAPNPTWFTKNLDSLPGIVDNANLHPNSWINIQGSFDAKGTLFIAVENFGGLFVLRNLSYDPIANGGSGTPFDVFRPPSPGLDVVDKPVMAIGPDGSGMDKQDAVYVTGDDWEDHLARKVTCLTNVDDPVHGNVKITAVEPIGATNGNGGTFCLAVEPNGDVATLVEDSDSTLYSATYHGPQLQSYSATNSAQVMAFVTSTITRPTGTFAMPLIQKQDATGNSGTNVSAGAIDVVSMDVNRSTGEIYATYVLHTIDSTSGIGSDESAVYWLRSTDGGSTWSTPQRVDPSLGTQFTAWVSIDQALAGQTDTSSTGFVSVLYYTTDGNAAGDNASVRPRLAVFDPVDGTWAYQDLTSASSNATLPDDSNYYWDYGDYVSVVATGGRAVTSWAFRDPDSSGSGGTFNVHAETVTLGTNTASAYAIPAASGDNAVTIGLDSSHNLQVTVNGVAQSGVGSPYSLVFTGQAGNDTLTIDESNGNPIARGGLSFDGGAGNNAISVIGYDSGSTGTSMCDNIATASGSSLSIDGGDISASNVASVQITGGSSADAFSVSGNSSYTVTLDDAATKCLLNIDATGSLVNWKPVIVSGDVGNTTIHLTASGGNNTFTYGTGGLTLGTTTPTTLAQFGGLNPLQIFDDNGQDKLVINAPLTSASSLNDTSKTAIDDGDSGEIDVNIANADASGNATLPRINGVAAGSYAINAGSYTMALVRPSLRPTSFIVANGSSMTFTPANTADALIDLTLHGSSAAFTADAGQSYTINTLEADGTSTISANTEVDITGNASIGAGTLTLAGTGSYAFNEIDMTNGALLNYTDTSQPLSIGSLAIGGDATLNASGEVEVSGDIAFAGTLTLQGSSVYFLAGVEVLDGGVFNVTDDAAVDMYSLTADVGGSFSLTNDSWSTITLLTCSGSAGGPASLIGGDSVYGIGEADVAGARLQLAGSNIQFLDATVEGGGQVELTGTYCDIKGTLSVDGSSAVVLTAHTDAVSPSTLFLDSLSIDSPSWLDVNNNSLWIQYEGGTDPMAQIFDYLKNGYSNGAWDGSGGIRSGSASSDSGHSTALGYVDDTTDGIILVTYALYGDTTLKGSVDLSDYNTLAANFNKPGSWSQGDFNYSGTVGLEDYNLMMPNFDKSL